MTRETKVGVCEQQPATLRCHQHCSTAAQLCVYVCGLRTVQVGSSRHSVLPLEPLLWAQECGGKVSLNIVWIQKLCMLLVVLCGELFGVPRRAKPS